MERYKESLKELECHFNWKIKEIVHDKDVTERLSNKNEEIAALPWRNVLILLTSTYELQMKKDFTEAKKKLKECTELFYRSINNDVFLKKYEKAFQHVIFSVKAFIYIDTSSETEIIEIFDCIPPFSSLPQDQKSAINGFKANVFGAYGIEGRKHSLQFARMAVEANPEEPEWSLLMGITLSRIRRHTYNFNISEEEIKYLEDAYKNTKEAPCMVYLAQAYSDVARAVNTFPEFKLKGETIKEKKKKLEIITAYNKNAIALYREALRINEGKSTSIMGRCAKGLYKSTPWNEEVLNEALDIINKIIHSDPNNKSAHFLATSIYHDRKQYELALKHAYEAKKEGTFYTAAIAILQIKCEQKKSEQKKSELNAEEYFDYLLKKYPIDAYVYQTHLLAVSYYIFEEYNLPIAIKHFILVADLKCMKRKDYIRFIVWIKKYGDLCRLVYNEAKRALLNKNYKNECEQQQFEEAIKLIDEKYPDVKTLGYDENFLVNLKKSTKEQTGPMRSRNNVYLPNKQKNWRQ